MAPTIDRIPVILLTGFLGSGKTTLLRELLKLPEAAGTAVLINELGAIGLDHQLAWGAADTTVVLENGCVCCSVQQDLAAALEDLFWKRLHRKIPRFQRVLIETTGIADPGRIVALFETNAIVAERFGLSSVVCTVDGLLGERQLRNHAESLAQAAIADLILLTKSDLADRPALEALERQLRRLNPAATLRRSSAGAAAAEVLSVSRGGHAIGSHEVPRGPDTTSEPLPGPVGSMGVHGQVASFVVRFDAFSDRGALGAMLSELLSRHGGQLLRIKGLVEVAGESGSTVVQAVGDRLYPFDCLPAEAQWEGPGFLVFITSGMSRQQLLAGGSLASNRAD